MLERAASKGADLPSPPITATDERRSRFEAVYEAYHGPILGYVLRRTATPDDAADIIAETFLTAWRRLEEMPPGPEARLWLYGVARRVLANHHRGERKRSVTPTKSPGANRSDKRRKGCNEQGHAQIRE